MNLDSEKSESSTCDIFVTKPSSIISFWLVPEWTTKRFFQKWICALAQRFNAPVFEPHVTVYSCLPGDSNSLAPFLAAAKTFAPIHLQIEKISCSENFTKTLFVELSRSNEIRRLMVRLKELRDDDSPISIEPHLSLVYQRLARSEKQHAARQIRIPFQVLNFPTFKVIQSRNPTRSKQDVENWKVIGETKLEGSRRVV